ncbi:hypothetical protein TVAGG3_0548770 [Trichomonas vaginalis G3]|nr:hypothetical protein TVAGG3_0548770 [Trichomonas vaginalis G3]KAI5520360.1 hypothetical protein TVAGG3_0548770 [Trichomonas vaginalis G3]
MVSILKKLFSYGMSPDTTIPDNITVSQPSGPLMVEEHYYYNTFDNKIIDELQKKQSKSNKVSIAIQSASETSIIPKNFTRKPKFQPKLCTELIDIIPPPVVEEPPPAQEVPQGKSVSGGLGAPKGQIKLSLGGKPNLSGGAAPTLNMSNGAAGTSIPKLQHNIGGKKDDDKSKDAKPTTGLKLNTPSLGGSGGGGLKLAAPKLSLSTTPKTEEAKPADAPAGDKPAEPAAAPAKPGGLGLSIPKLGTTLGAKPGGLSLAKPGVPAAPAAKPGGLSLSIPKIPSAAPTPAAPKEPEAPAETTTTTTTPAAPAAAPASKPGFNFTIPKAGAPKPGGITLPGPKAPAAPATGAKPGITSLSLSKPGSGFNPVAHGQPAAPEAAPPAVEQAPAAEQPPASEQSSEQPAPEPAPPAESKPSLGFNLSKPAGSNLPKFGGFNLNIPGKPAAKPAEPAPANTSAAAQASGDEWDAVAGQPPPPAPATTSKPGNTGLGLSLPSTSSAAPANKGWGTVGANNGWSTNKPGNASSGWSMASKPSASGNGWGSSKASGNGWGSGWKK